LGEVFSQPLSGATPVDPARPGCPRIGPIGRWTLLDLFLVLILALGSTRLWGWAWGLTAGLTLILTWQIPQAPHLIWVNLLAAAALKQVLRGPAAVTTLVHLRTAVAWYQRLALAALLVVGLPFVAGQVRTGLLRAPGTARGWVGRHCQHRPVGWSARRRPIDAGEGRPQVRSPARRGLPSCGPLPAEASASRLWLALAHSPTEVGGPNRWYARGSEHRLSARRIAPIA
jgi:hypothetical protein